MTQNFNEATIADGETTSSAFELTGNAISHLVLVDVERDEDGGGAITWDSATFTTQVAWVEGNRAPDATTDWWTVCDTTGANDSYTTTAGKAIVLDYTRFLGARYLRIVTNVAETTGSNGRRLWLFATAI